MLHKQILHCQKEKQEKRKENVFFDPQKKEIEVQNATFHYKRIKQTIVY